MEKALKAILGSILVSCKTKELRAGFLMKNLKISQKQYKVHETISLESSRSSIDW